MKRFLMRWAAEAWCIENADGHCSVLVEEGPTEWIGRHVAQFRYTYGANRLDFWGRGEWL